MDALGVTLQAGAATDVGLRRRINEDSMFVGHPLYVVADGMGGHDAGDRASQAVVQQLSTLAGRADLEPDHLTVALDAAQVAVSAIADGESNGAGSTVTGVVAITRDGRPHWLVFNIGDSRVYRLRDGVLEQLTVDHSIAQQLIESGELAREDAGTFTGRNVITKAVGADDSAADFWLYPIVASEALVLCSDGLTGEVDEVAIAAIVDGAGDPQQAADRLVAAALAGGGRDNVTVVVVRVESGGIDASLDEATGVVQPVEAEDDDGATIELPRVRRG
jgi:protein phosphatase